MPALDDLRHADERVLDVLRAAHARGAWVLSVCSGAFVLAASGLLDGRPSTTHWRHAARLQAFRPATRVDPDVLFVEDDKIVTSAGTASAIDASLHIVRRELGAAAANTIARRMVVPPQRDGGQAQYIALPRPGARGRLAGRAARLGAGAPRRGPLRRRARTPGAHVAAHVRPPLPGGDRHHPCAWVVRQRLRRAQQLLETADLPVDEVARSVGFGTGGVLRHHFTTVLGTSPQAYRRRFSLAGA